MKVISIREGACSNVMNRLDSFWIRELPIETMRVVLRHLLNCEACLRVLQIREGARKQLRLGARREVVPVELEPKLREQIGNRASRRRLEGANRGS
jgi:hypothetical protein